MQNKEIKIGHFKNKKSYINKSDKEIKEIAKGIYKGIYFSSLQIHPNDSDMIMMIFMPLAFLSPIDRKQLLVDEITHFYGELSSASPRSVNGYPCMFSMQMLDRTDTEKLIVEYNKILDVMGDKDE